MEGYLVVWMVVSMGRLVVLGEWSINEDYYL